ncbi:MAG: DsbA family protein [Sphingomonadales bacterium]
MPRLAELATAGGLLASRRALYEAGRRSLLRPREILFFHDVSDPYSYLLAQALPGLIERYRVEIKPVLVPPFVFSSDSNARLLEEYARRDAGELADRTGFAFHDPGRPPPKGAVMEVARRLSLLSDTQAFLEEAAGGGGACWRQESEREPHEPQGSDPGTDDGLMEKLAEGGRLRAALGHYSGGMLYFGGEWYWGLDRLHYLEERLRDSGASRQPGLPRLVGCPEESAGPPHDGLDGCDGDRRGAGKTLEVFFSFRSPYSYLALEELPDLIRRTGVKILLRPVYPMILRGVPLPPGKLRYILFDCAREARRLKIPFGRIADSLLGNGFEKALAIFPQAASAGLGLRFARLALRASFAEGKYLKDEEVLRRVAEETGLSWPGCRPEINDQAWLGAAHLNAESLRKMGLWGVPSFNCGALSCWGRDRLWMVEKYLSESVG